MRTYKLSANTAAATANLASITFAKSGKIVGIKWSCAYDSVTDNAMARTELSFQSTTMIGTNDTAGPIDEVGFAGNFATSGLAQSGINQQTVNLNIPVGLGEKIYLNHAVTGTITSYVTCFIYVED